MLSHFYKGHLLPLRPQTLWPGDVLLCTCSGMFWCSRGSRGLDRIPREGLMCYLSSYICTNRTALEDKQYKACLAVCLCVLRTCWHVCLQVLESNHMFSDARPHTELYLLLSPLIHTSLTGRLPVLKSLIIGWNWALITLSWGIIRRNKREKDTQSQHIGMRHSSKKKLCKRIKSGLLDILCFEPTQ